MIVVPQSGALHIPLHVQRGGRELMISGNLLVSDHPQTLAALRLSEVAQRPVTRALVSDNLCITRSGTGIGLLSADDVAVQGNMVVSTGACAAGILIRAQSSDVDGISVRDNHITVEEQGTWQTGIRVVANPHSVDDLSIVGNSIRGAANGVTFAGSGFRRTPVCALNHVSADASTPLMGTPLAGLENLPEKAVVVAGAASRGGSDPSTGAGRHLTGLGDPTKPADDPKSVALVGNVGDIYQRLDQPPDDQSGQIFYVKETGNGTTTGWIAK